MSMSINVASNSGHLNGRGLINPNNYYFEYLPIPETKECKKKVPTYSDLEWIDDKRLKKPNLKVHLDPEFDTYTYGHAKRGFGDTKILNLGEGDYLFFHSTLDNQENPDLWLTAIVGYFEIDDILDCRDLTSTETRKKAGKKFRNNAHLKRKKCDVDFLIKGSDESRLLDRAIPLSEFDTPLVLKEEFENLIKTSGGKDVKDEKPWFRWTLKVHDPINIVRRIE